MSGRGPTMLISPNNTFRSCGSSSSLVFRRKFPKEETVPFCRCMVRILYSRNGFPYWPIRVWIKMPLPVSKWAINNKIRMAQPKSNRQIEARKISKKVFRGICLLVLFNNSCWNAHGNTIGRYGF